MSVLGSEIELQAGDTRFGGYRSRPVGGGPGVVVLHEGFGLDDCTLEASDRLARAGFLTLAPALSDETTTRSPAEAKLRAKRWDRDAVATRVQAAISMLQGDSACAGGRVGILGAGTGGAMGLHMMGGNASIGAVVDFSGLPEEPVLSAGADASQVLLVFGEEDPAGAGGAFETQVEALRAQGCEVTLRQQPGVGPDFTSEAWVDRFDARAAAESWDAALAFLRAALCGVRSSPGA